MLVPSISIEPFGGRLAPPGVVGGSLAAKPRGRSGSYLFPTQDVLLLNKGLGLPDDIISLKEKALFMFRSVVRLVTFEPGRRAL